MHFAFVLGRESEVVIFCVKLPHQNRLLVDQAASPCLIFFVEIGSLRRPSVLTFGLKVLSMLLKMGWIISRIYLGTPWQVGVKSSR